MNQPAQRQRCCPEEKVADGSSDSFGPPVESIEIEDLGSEEESDVQVDWKDDASRWSAMPRRGRSDRRRLTSVVEEQEEKEVEVKGKKSVVIVAVGRRSVGGCFVLRGGGSEPKEERRDLSGCEEGCRRSPRNRPVSGPGFRPVPAISRLIPVEAREINRGESKRRKEEDVRRDSSSRIGDGERDCDPKPYLIEERNRSVSYISK